MHSGLLFWREQREWRLLSIAFPAPLLYPLVDLFVVTLFNQPSTLAQSLLESAWPSLLAVLLLGLALSFSAWRRARTFGLPGTDQVAWAIFVFLFGLAGFVGFLLHRRWPLRTECPHCHARVPRDRPACARCKLPFPGQAQQGIEGLRLRAFLPGARNMVLAIVAKELRELRMLAALALFVYGIYLSNLTGHWHYQLRSLLGWLPGLGPLPDFPFVQDDFGMIHGFIGFSLAIALGFRQSVCEFLQGTAPYLLHRPMSRRAIILSKLLAGAGLLLACTVLPILVYGAWAAMPGTHPSPFEWSMAAPMVHNWLAMPLVYLGAFASGIRPARWFGSRLLPLIAVIPPAMMLPFFPRWPLIGLPLLMLTIVAMISNILLEAKTRDF